MINKIRTYIEEKKYYQALELIETELSKISDIQTNEVDYTDLLQSRIIAKFFLGEKDVIVRDQVRKEMFPSETVHLVENTYPIKLIYKSSFQEKCDAYINTVYVDNPFQETTRMSATHELLNRMGNEELERQIKHQPRKVKGDFIILEHETMSAPSSYHILFYSEEDTDLGLLEAGITNVLNDVCKKRLRSISFFPLGFDLVVRAEQSQKNFLAEKIADKTAEIIVGYILANKHKFIPKINFNFVTVITMLVYQKAFSKWADFKKPYFNLMKQISEKEKNIVNGALTRDPHYIESLKEIAYAVDDKSSILLLGETGVGKSFLSHILQKNSSRSGKPFKEINCQQITRDLIYAQLFGSVKGSYTGATSDKDGAIKAAEGGVLFLDEIAYADLDVQRSLLKFFDDGKYSRLGEERITQQADVKLIFGTNVDLEKSVEENTFAHDLLERISSNRLTIPPLRKRKDDIPLFIEYFKNDININSSFKVEIPKETVELLTTYNWPGNIRQLGHYIGDMFRKARSKNILFVNPSMIFANPPRNELRTKNPMRILEKTLLEILQSWEIDNGNLLEAVVKPMLSKLYVENFKGKVKESNKFIGIDGTRGSKNALTMFHKKYHEIKDT